MLWKREKSLSHPGLLLSWLFHGVVRGNIIVKGMEGSGCDLIRDATLVFDWRD
jgi:hypothetical protein